MIEKSIVSSQGEVFYWHSNCSSGDAKTIFFLHGLIADHTLFEKQIEYFISEFNIIVWDTPLHGKSRPYSDFSYENCADNIKIILDNENISHAIFVGQCMGGWHIQALIKKYHPLVQAFVAIDTSPFGQKYYSKIDMWWLKQAEWMMRCFSEELLKNAISESIGTTEYAKQNMSRALHHYSKKELCRLMGLSCRGFVNANEDITIQCPTIILLGDSDKTGKVKYYSEAWHKATGFPLYIISNAVHNSNADNPQQVNAIIHKFILGL